MKDTPENRGKREVAKLLRMDGWFVQFNPQFGPFVTRGRPDLEAYKQGKILLVECKSSVGKQSDDQKKYQAKVAPFAPYILARSVEDIKPYLTQVQMLF